MTKVRLERLGAGIEIYAGGAYAFGTDAFLLADFSAPKADSACCDLCAGCGVVSLLWLRRAPRPGRIAAVELSAGACGLLRDSLRHNGLDGAVEIHNMDLREARERLPAGQFDLVCCNPPYFSASSGGTPPQRERRLARQESPESCTCGEICEAARWLLKNGGRLCLCQRPERLPDVLEAMRGSGIEPKRLRMVQQRPESAPWLILAEGRKGGRPSLKVEPPLIIKDERGGFTGEVLRIYDMPATAEEKRDV